MVYSGNTTLLIGLHCGTDKFLHIVFDFRQYLFNETRICCNNTWKL